MTTEITTYKNITPAQVDLIKSQIAVGASDDELKLFLHVADKSSLDPLSRQIYFIKRSGKMTIQTGIDGFRAVADRTGQYVGSSDPVFEDNGNIPAKATVTVNKVVGGIVGNFTATARWQEYYPGKSQGFMWDKMPHTMLGKCAEALALRKAFPAQLSGLYTSDEMDQAGDQGIPNNTKDINPKGGSKQLEEILIVPENKVNNADKVILYQVAEKELDEGFAFCADKNIHDNIINHLNDIKYEETPQSMEVLNNFATSHPENQTKFQDIAREKNKEWQSNLSEDGYTQLRAWMVTLNNFFTLTQEEIA